MGREVSQGPIQKTVYIGMVLGHDGEGNPVICMGMDGPAGHYAEGSSRPEKDKCSVVTLIGAVF